MVVEEAGWERYLRDLLGRTVRTALQDLDNPLVLRWVLRKANFQLPKKLATLLKSLLLLKLPEWKEGESSHLLELLERTRRSTRAETTRPGRGVQGSG